MVSVVNVDKKDADKRVSLLVHHALRGEPGVLSRTRLGKNYWLFCNSSDFLIRDKEVLSGGQCIYCSQHLEKCLEENGIRPRNSPTPGWHRRRFDDEVGGSLYGEGGRKNYRGWWRGQQTRSRADQQTFSWRSNSDIGAILDSHSSTSRENFSRWISRDFCSSLYQKS